MGQLSRAGDARGPLLVCPLYAALGAEQQLKVFDPAPPGTRKVASLKRHLIVCLLLRIRVKFEIEVSVGEV